MNYVEVSAGVGTPSLAWRKLGWMPLLYSEIAHHPRLVLRQRHGAIDQRHYTPKHAAEIIPVLWGDFTTIRTRHLRRLLGHADVDLLVGGTPCQSYSVAGKRGGLDDPRGELSLEFALLAYRLGVRWFVWENVPGVFSSAEGQDFAAILSAFTGRVVEVPEGGWQNSGVIPESGPGHFGIAWRVLDAQHFGVPQRRRRVFVIGHLGDWRRAAAVLLELYGVQGHPAPSRAAGQDVTHATAPCLTGSGSGVERTGDTRGKDPVVAVISGTLSASGKAAGSATQQDAEASLLVTASDGGGAGVPTVFSIMPQNSGKDYKARQVEVAQPVMAGGPVGGNQGGDYVVAPTFAVRTANTTANGMGVAEEVAHTLDGVKVDRVLGPHAMAVRRLTAVECERLQGLPDGFTAVLNYTSTLRYSWAKGRFVGRAEERLTWTTIESDEEPYLTPQGHQVRRRADGRLETNILADGPRYKMIGNGMAKPVLEWIGERIAKVDALPVARALCAEVLQ